MRARAGASDRQVFWDAPLESRDGGGGASGTRRPGGWATLYTGASRQDRYSPKGAPWGKADTLAQALWHSTRWCFGRWLESLRAHAACNVSLQLALNRAFWDHVAQYVARHGAAPKLVVGDLNFDLDRLLRAPLCILGDPPCPPPGGRGPRGSVGRNGRFWDEFLYHVYSMHPAVLIARMAAGRGDAAGSRGGGRARSLYATPPSPPPPRVLTDSGLGTWRQRRPPFFRLAPTAPPFLV